MNSSSLASLLTPEAVAQLKRLELFTTRRIDTDLVGSYRSAFRGSGLVVTDCREYQPGDDVKHIHWKMTARSGKVYVKSYEEDRQLRIVLAVDTSSSLLAGGVWRGNFKSNQTRALELCALLSILAGKNQDSVGLVMFSDDIEEFIPPKHSQKHTHALLLKLMGRTTSRPSTNVGLALTHISEQVRRRSVVFVVSDFYTAPFEHELRRLSAHHDVVLALLDYDLEATIPRAGIVEWIDSESGEKILFDSSSKSSRNALISAYERRRTELRALCSKCGVDIIRILDNPLTPLAELMRTRTHRVR